MADWHKKGVKGVAANVDKGPGSKSGRKEKGSVPEVSGTQSVNRNEKTHDVQFAKGGSTSMFGEQAAGDQKPGGTAHNVSGGAPGEKFASGGKNKMFGFLGSVPARDGITGNR